MEEASGQYALSALSASNGINTILVRDNIFTAVWFWQSREPDR